MSSLPRLAIPLLLALSTTTLSAQEVDLETGIVYAKRGDLELKLDLALPPGDGKLRPAVVCIHGGGWRAGERSVYHGPMTRFAKLGYVAASIDYRLTSVATWPAQRDDVRAALRWLVDHASEYSVDPERIALLGDSAGGHLSLILGLLPDERQEGLRVRAVVNFYGPTDLRSIENLENARPYVEGLVGGKLEEKTEVLKQASPVFYVDRTDPPVLTFHGTADELVPIFHARTLHAALEKAQIPNHLEPMEGVGHGLGDQKERVFGRLQEAFRAYLKGSDLPLVAHEDFDTADSSARWQPTDKTAWKVVSREGRTFYSLVKNKSDYEPRVRSPLNISLLDDVEVADFVLDVDLRSTNRPYGHQSLCLFFGHQDPTHFYYVHFGRDADAHANSVFLVDDAPRVSIAKERTDGTDWSRGWHRARIRREVESGRIEVYFDDMTEPVMVAVDKTFTSGRVGVGSFDDIGDFDSIRLYGRKIEGK